MQALGGHSCAMERDGHGMRMRSPLLSRGVSRQEVASEAVRSGLPLVNFCSAFEVAAKKGHIEIQVLQGKWGLLD